MKCVKTFVILVIKCSHLSLSYSHGYMWGNKGKIRLFNFHPSMCLFPLYCQAFLKEIPHSDGEVDPWPRFSWSHFCFISFTYCRCSQPSLFIVWRNNCFIMRKRSRNVVFMTNRRGWEGPGLLLCLPLSPHSSFPWREMSSCFVGSAATCCGVFYRIRMGYPLARPQRNSLNER